MGLEIDVGQSPEDALALFSQLEEGGGSLPEPEKLPAAEPEKKPAVEQKAAVDEPNPTADQGQPDLSEEQIAGVSTKDGKHVIPYSVLKAERDRAARAEQIAREAVERVEALQAQVAAGSQGAKQGEPARTDDQPKVNELTEDDLNALREDFPTVYKAVMASMAAAKALESQLKPVAETVQTVTQERERTQAEAVQDAIDSNPKLAHIQVADKAAFDLAKSFDATLRQQPAWADKPLAERFAKVTEMVESALGPIKLPGLPASQDAADLAKAAKALAAKAAKETRTSVPTSLSEFPAGQPPAQDERQALEQLSPLQLAEKLNAMTPDQMEAYFQNL